MGGSQSGSGKSVLAKGCGRLPTLPWWAFQDHGLPGNQPSPRPQNPPAAPSPSSVAIGLCSALGSSPPPHAPLCEKGG